MKMFSINTSLLPTKLGECNRIFCSFFLPIKLAICEFKLFLPYKDVGWGPKYESRLHLWKIKLAFSDLKTFGDH